MFRLCMKETILFNLPVNVTEFAADTVLGESGMVVKNILYGVAAINLSFIKVLPTVDDFSLGTKMVFFSRFL